MLLLLQQAESLTRFLVFLLWLFKPGEDRLAGHPLSLGESLVAGIHGRRGRRVWRVTVTGTTTAVYASHEATKLWRRFVTMN